MFGRDPNLPIDIAFGLCTEAKKQPRSKYIMDLRNRLSRAFDIASRAADKARSKQKEGYDNRSRGATLETGDRVLVRVVAHQGEGKHKIADRWEEDVYIIRDQPNSGIPVYAVEKENGQGRRRTLHRNLLLPVDYIQDKVSTPEPVPTNRPTPAPRTRQQRKQPSPEPTEIIESSDEESFGPIRVVHGDPHIAIDDTQDTVTDDLSHDTESVGDAHSTVSGDSSDDSGSTTGSASGESEDVEQQQQDTVVLEDTFATPEPDTRRSARVRREPGWMRSGDYVTMSANPVKQPWQQRADYLTSCMKIGLFSGLEQKAAEALLTVITDTKD